MSRGPRRFRVLARVGALVVVSVALLLGASAPANAHPTLLFTDPGPDSAVPESPRAITLVFNEPVTAGARGVVVLDGEGREMSMGQVRAAKEGHAVVAPLTAALRPGSYVVRWRVTGSDGDLMEEQFRFAVGTAIFASGTAAGGQPIAWIEAALRWLLFAGFAVALGGVVGERLTASARAESPSLRTVAAPVASGAAVALLGVVALGAVLSTEVGTVAALWEERIGLLLSAEAAGLTLAVGVASLGGRFRVWAAAPLLVVAAAEGVRSHANASVAGWGALLTGMHVAAVAVWVGALVHVVRAAVAWRGETAAVRWVLTGYARLALWVFLLVVGTGTVSALLLVPLPAVASTTYGRVLLIKLALVAVAAGLAFAARRRLLHPERLGGVRALARVEGGVLIAVLAVSAVLVSTPPAWSQPVVPPPPRGQVLPLGTLAGQVGVNAAISDRQLVVRLSTPRRGDYYEEGTAQEYRLSGVVQASGSGSAPLEFRRCGEGCFVASASWRGGDNVLTLRAEADGWRGGTVSLLVPWPASSGERELKRAVAAMREVEHVTMYETVTSDTTAGLPEPQPIELSSKDFLSLAPYGSGIAPIAARTSGRGEPIRLALGFPAASVTVRFTLDEGGRIVEETLTDAKHLIHRRFVYDH